VALELQGCGAAVPVVVCGRNEALARQLREDGIEHAYGWVDDMPGLMHAADVLVQNAGGLTSLEAFAAGLPVASYRCIPGHGPANAAALDEAGVAVWIQDAAELRDVLRDLIGGPRGLLQREAGLALFAAGRGPADAIARACGARAPLARAPLPVPLAVAASGVRGTGAGTGAAPCAVRGAGAGAAVAPCAAGGTGARPAVAPSAADRIRTRPALRRLAATAAAACTVWACAVGTAVATTDTGTRVMHAIGRTLDLDGPPHAHHPEGHRS
jgi:hypothetical protein